MSTNRSPKSSFLSLDSSLGSATLATAPSKDLEPLSKLHTQASKGRSTSRSSPFLLVLRSFLLFRITTEANCLISLLCASSVGERRVCERGFLFPRYQRSRLDTSRVVQVR